MDNIVNYDKLPIEITKVDRVPLVALSKEDIDQLPKEIWMKFECYLKVEKNNVAWTKCAQLYTADIDTTTSFEDAKYAFENFNKADV